MPDARGSSLSTWTVVGEPTIEETNERMWIVRGHVSRMPLGRYMVVVRMEDGRLLVHNAVALPEADMKRLEAWGEVAYLVVPNGFHRMDAKAFADRYPNAKVVAPTGARAKVEEVVPVDLTYERFEGDGVVSLQHAAGIDEKEGVMTVTAKDGKTMVFTDLLFNVPHQRGLIGLVIRLMGSTGGPRVTWLFRKVALRDKEALRGFLQRLSGTEGLVRLVPGHGLVIDEAPSQTLAAVAERL
jgi:hypothetical protein